MLVKFIIDSFDVRFDSPGELQPVKIIDCDWDYPVLPRIDETIYLAGITPREYKRYYESTYIVHSIDWGIDSKNVPYIFLQLENEQDENIALSHSEYSRKRPHAIKELFKNVTKSALSED